LKQADLPHQPLSIEMKVHASWRYTLRLQPQRHHGLEHCRRYAQVESSTQRPIFVSATGTLNSQRHTTPSQSSFVTMCSVSVSVSLSNLSALSYYKDIIELAQGKRRQTASRNRHGAYRARSTRPDATTVPKGIRQHLDQHVDVS